MKKICFILTLTIILVGAFSAVAFGAQTLPNPGHTTPFFDGVQDGTVNAHGGFTYNGDTCSVCHSMHYAGSFLTLTANTNTANESLSCLACHDGTTGNYNVLAGVNGALEPAMGGLFANYPVDNSTVDSGSMHNAFGTVEAYIAAPGGRGSATEVIAKVPTYDRGTWVVNTDGSSKLTCGSCHDAHKSINPRLLSVNPNGIMDDLALQQSGVNAQKADGTAQTYAADKATKYYFPTTPGSNIVVKVAGVELTEIADYQVKWTTAESAPVTLNDAGGSLAPGTRAAKPGYNAKFTVDKAYVIITTSKTLTAGDAVTFDYKPALTVQMGITNWNAVGERIQYGNGVENFCTACHTDFKGSRTAKVGSATVANLGVFGGLAHHTGDRPNEGEPMLGNYVPESISGGLTEKESVGSCLTCHYAHGTNQARWETASKADPDGAKYLNPDGTSLYAVKELRGSSALKRGPNESICSFCHEVVATNGSGQSYTPIN